MVYSFMWQFYTLTLILGHNMESEWITFKIRYERIFENITEENRRKEIFEKHFRTILNHNYRYRLGKETYEMDLNKFSDKLDKEIYGGCIIRTNNYQDNVVLDFHKIDNDQLPSEVDWTKNNAVTLVKNQRGCGSCWAFSATGTLEGQLYRSTGKLIALSEQNLMDCGYEYGTRACVGGWPFNALKYVQDNGIMDEASYQYTGNSSRICKHRNPENSVMKIGGIVAIPKNDEASLRAAVAKVGPISVVMDAKGPFIHYKSGVYYNPYCGNELNHATLIVGYGKDDASGMDYWLVKNSWGADWGSNGYAKVARNMNNHCEIATAAIYALV